MDKKSKFSKIKAEGKKTFSGFVLSVILVLLLVPIVAFARPIIEEQKANLNRNNLPSSKPYIQPSLAPTVKPKTINKTTTTNNSGKIDCTGPDGVVFKTTQKECDDFNTAWGNNKKEEQQSDPNEIIKCYINPNCGGGYKEMRRSDCDNTTCCPLGSNRYELREKKQCSMDICNVLMDDNFTWSDCMKAAGY